MQVFVPCGVKHLIVSKKFSVSELFLKRMIDNPEL